MASLSEWSHFHSVKPGKETGISERKCSERISSAKKKQIKARRSSKMWHTVLTNGAVLDSTVSVFLFQSNRRQGRWPPPAVINREHFFFENMLRHDAVKHRRDAVDGHAWVAHPQDAVKLGKDKGHGRQRGGLSKHLDDRNASNLQRRRGKNNQRSVGAGRSLLCQQLKL